MQWFLIEFFFLIGFLHILFVKRISKRLCVADLVLQLCWSLAWRAGKKTLSLGLCWIWYIKRQFGRFRMPGNLNILHSLYALLMESWRYFPESTALKLLECCCCFIFMLHSCVTYCKWDSNSEWYAVFRILMFVLIWNLPSMPIARLILNPICAICLLLQSRCSSIRTPRKLIEWVGISLLPSNLNLKLWSIFSFLSLKIISSVFFTLRLSFFLF